jgi:prevent-host-death family protein
MYIYMYMGVEMAERTVSIAEARTHLPGLVRDAESGAAVEITRRGVPVAILVSTAKYHQLTSGKESFGEALDEFLQVTPVGEIGLETGEFETLRDRDVGREVKW